MEGWRCKAVREKEGVIVYDNSIGLGGGYVGWRVVGEDGKYKD